MKKIRSKKLFEYLQSVGVLSQGAEAIAKARKEYRKRYKREWKKNRNVPIKEIRPCFSLKDYLDIQVRACEFGVSPTSYVKQVVLLELNNKKMVPHIGELKKVLQLLGIAQNSYGDMVVCLPEAEKLLLDYIQGHDC